MIKKFYTFLSICLLWSSTSAAGFYQNITLRDIERYCEVYMYSNSKYGDIECSRSHLRPIERKCEGYLYSGKYGDIECRGSDFREVERRCEFYMYSKRYGEIDC
tara:strand:+ start:355 stop:666 length:312 start_codon:yes stop_codon:yes gene_type:complete